MGSNPSESSSHHVVLFPFMSKGHTIPLLHLAHLLLRRPTVTVTVITTPSNRPFISTFLHNTTASIIDLPFPQNIPQIPDGVESTDKLPFISLFVPFARATELMQQNFEHTLENIRPVTFLVSDGFLWWTLDSATKLRIPRLVFYGMNNYSMCIGWSVGVNNLLSGPESDDELISVTEFPWIEVTKNDFKQPFDTKGSHSEFVTDTIVSTSNSYGLIVNSFYELESVFVDYLNRQSKSKVWCVGPLCLADSLKIQIQRQGYLQWLDRKLEQGCSVLYVAFGTQTDFTAEQVKEIANGLEDSEVNFMWVMREKEEELGDGYEERVKGRGIVVREWVEQREILYHQTIQGFLSHCGWNTVMESICAGVPILAWPVMAEQPLNARMVVEEIKVGLRVETCDGSVRGFVKKEGLEKSVKELMEGKKGREVRKKVKEYAEMAKRAMEEDKGSSWCTLDLLIKEMSNYVPQDKEHI